MQHTEGTFPAFDGTTIHHQAWLPDGGARAVIVLVHGLGEHSGRYRHVAQVLVDAGYAVHALDHRGHGRSSGKRAFVKHYDEFLRDLHQFRRMVEAEHPGTPLVLLGHSMGGNIAVGYTLAHQDGIAALVLSGPALEVGEDFSPLRLKIFAAIAKVAPGLRPQGAAYRRDPLVFTGKVSAGLGAALIGAMQTFPDRYEQLRLPILVLHGTDDQLADVAGSRELEAGAVNADLTAHYYEGLYHEVFNEPEQDRVLADLTTWLDAHL